MLRIQDDVPSPYVTVPTEGQRIQITFLMLGSVVTHLLIAKKFKQSVFLDRPQGYFKVDVFTAQTRPAVPTNNHLPEKEGTRAKLCRLETPPFFPERPLPHRAKSGNGDH